MMQKYVTFFLFGLTIGCQHPAPQAVKVSVTSSTEVPCLSGSGSTSPAVSPSVCFSPKGNCTEMLVKKIQQAIKTIYVQAYSFTSAPIAASLVEMSNKGVNVQIILDSADETERSGQIQVVASQKVPTFLDDAHAISHNKVMIIDERYVVGIRRIKKRRKPPHTG